VALLSALLPLTFLAFYTSATPLVLPETNVTPDEREDLTRRWLDFQDAIQTDRVPVSFMFSSRDFNVFVDMMPRLCSRVYGAFEGTRLHEQFCLPFRIGPTTRYLKGTAAITFALKDGELAINVISCRVNGHALPGWACRQLGRKSLSPEAFGILERFDIQPHLRSIEVRDSCVVLTARQADPPEEESESPLR
jgi:hypothetical protein